MTELADKDNADAIISQNALPKLNLRPFVDIRNAPIIRMNIQMYFKGVKNSPRKVAANIRTNMGAR